ncbi:MAG: membrane protein insertase YidC [Candidatus Tectomicrobia bacterium]|uniref:Membrane protein insertase YidC n=1 Tax=Tectimicrobiota bacterium TaxID=2528274 RepID=A0A932CNK9_UNCTE|nr:membrane protein insertase YidC [Candidatus Tectomicrobia bacterium]
MSQSPGVLPRPLAGEEAAGSAGEQEYVVDTALTRVVFSNRGGQIKALYLKEYRDKHHRPVNLVVDRAGGAFPLHLRSGSERLDWQINFANYQASSPRLQLSPSSPTGTLVLSYRNASGWEVVKSYHFKYNSYAMGLDISIRNLPQDEHWRVYQVLWGYGIPRNPSQDGGELQPREPKLFLNDKLVKEEGNGSGQTKHYGNISWVAIDNKYFVVALVPQQTFSTAVVEREGKERRAIGLEFVRESSTLSNRLQIYAGPKEINMLKSQGAYLERVIDYGWVDFLARPLLQILKYFYQYLGNYGVAIILLTVLIKIAFSPLSHKSFKSMQSMQRIQPKIKELQERYGNDRQKLNQEMMNLYRQYKVNPLGGCLPMLLQIPVFFALYYVLQDAIELRKAPFFWWVQDLSEKDPYYIYPILMGITMFIQQKMTPQTGDPRQNQIMMFMPLIFTVLFLNFPAGLVIYWLVNNILTIGQQYTTMKLMGAAPAPSKVGSEQSKLQVK